MAQEASRLKSDVEGLSLCMERGEYRHVAIRQRDEGYEAACRWPLLAELHNITKPITQAD